MIRTVIADNYSPLTHRQTFNYAKRSKYKIRTIVVDHNNSQSLLFYIFIFLGEVGVLVFIDIINLFLIAGDVY